MQRKVLLAIAIMFLAGTVANAAVLEVGPGKPYADIASAIADAYGGTLVYSNWGLNVPGDEIVVYAGTYAGFSLTGNDMDLITVRAYKDPADCATPAERVVLTSGVNMNNWAEANLIKGFYIANTTGSASISSGSSACGRMTTYKNMVIYGGPTAISEYLQYGQNRYENCTIYGNDSTLSMGYASGGYPRDTIVAFNTASAGSSAVYSDYSCWYSNGTDAGYGSATPGANDIQVDPLFASTNPADNEFLWLQVGSPCAGTGEFGDMGALPVVPEPMTLALLGLASTFAIRRRRS
jgi:hypothetical protein